METNIITLLFTSGAFEPHGAHFIPDHMFLLWSLVIGNGFIALLYFVMPFELLYIYFKRKDFPFRWAFAAIPFFGFWCSATHVVMIISYWYPLYHLQGIVDFITGIVSFATFVAFVPATYHALKLSSPESLSEENDRLVKEIQNQRTMKAKMAQKNVELSTINAEVYKKNEELSELNKKMIAQELKMTELKREIFKYEQS